MWLDIGQQSGHALICGCWSWLGCVSRGVYRRINTGAEALLQLGCHLAGVQVPAAQACQDQPVLGADVVEQSHWMLLLQCGGHRYHCRQVRYCMPPRGKTQKQKLLGDTTADTHM